MTRRTKITLGFIAVAVTAVGVAVWLGLPAAREESHAAARSGELCTSCHEMPEHAARHEANACTDCHGDAPELAEQLTASWLLGTRTPEHGAVAAGTCTSCHVAPSVPHDGHGGAQCATCHEGEHAEEGPVECTSCHERADRHGVTAETPCTTCHSFGGELEVPTPALSAGLTRGLDPERIHGEMDCRRCHDPHQEEQPEVVCSRCHRGDIEAQVEHATEGHQDCQGCHTPHAPRDQPAVDCLQCHLLPTSDGAWQTMPDGVPEALRAEASEVAHDGQCGSCHEPHTWVATETRCLSCHEDHVSPIHEGCTSSCHEPHAPKPTGAVCRTCHEGVQHGSGLPGAHTNCLSCHDAHGGRPDSASACGACHQDAHGEAAASRTSHRRCTTCHEPHGPPRQGAATSCANCHQAVAALVSTRVAGVPAQHRCDGCHQPHRFGAGALALARCASCHAAAVAEGASHRGACEGCHEPHGAPGARAARCETCHEAVHPEVGGHQRCEGCHTPHQPAAAATSNCRGCHAQVVARAARWPTNGPHDGECAACHATHDEASTVACATCHLEQSARDHTGGHASCTGCHAPHAQAPPASWWDRCATCHTEEARGSAASRGTHARCENCHENPGPPLPTCQGCHQEMPQRLAHRAHGRAACTTCHATHGPSDIDRVLCTGCHQDRVRHFPDAPRCQSCHPFGP
ncbi:MAG: cytochrome c3 family protein [Sandaracinaceae bacterium]|nr:cytochrome c3 family protein [Sandaracinaceae bacterium]